MIKRLSLASLVLNLISIATSASHATEVVISDDGPRTRSRFTISDARGSDTNRVSPPSDNMGQTQQSESQETQAGENHSTPRPKWFEISNPLSLEEPIQIPAPPPQDGLQASLSPQPDPDLCDGTSLNCEDDGCGGGCGVADCTECWSDDCARTPYDYLCEGGNSRQWTRGWFSNLTTVQGFTWNPDNPASNFNTPLTFNDRANEYQFNQIYLSLGRRTSNDPVWDVGAQMDLLYGTDYFFTQSAGLETRIDGTRHWNGSGPRGAGNALYGLAMPQLFAEFQTPFMGGTNIKVGHFYSVLKYEAVPSAKNFFYSRAYTMQYGEPFTHTGILVNRSLGHGLELQTGVTRGWNNWEDNNDNNGFLGHVSWTSPDGLSTLSFGLHTSNEDDADVNDTTIYSFVLTQVINCRCRYVFQHDFGTEDGGEFDTNDNPETAKWYGINQYLFYDLSPHVSLGMRMEWFRDQDNSRVFDFASERLVQGGNYTALTSGINWQATSHMTVRSELRGDWSDVIPIATGGVYDDFSDRNQFTWATDIILTF